MKKKKINKITCEICGIKTCRLGEDKRIFMAKFPLNAARCKQWVTVTGKVDLVHVPIKKLHQLKYICGNHFKPKDFKKKHTQLKKTAVPSLGITAEPLKEELLIEFPKENTQLKKTAVPFLGITTKPLKEELLIEFPPYVSKNHNIEPSYTNTGVTKHHFPNPKKHLERFRIWVNLAGDALKNMSDDYIYKHKQVCDKHFIDDHRNRYKRLNTLAVPTLHLPGNKLHNVTKTSRTLQDHTYYIGSVGKDPQDVLESSLEPVARELTVNSKKNLEPQLHDDMDTQSDDCSPETQDEIPDAELFSWNKESELVSQTEEQIAVTDHYKNIDDTDDILMYDDASQKHNQSKDGNVQDGMLAESMEDNQLHKGYVCNLCKTTIVGFRYTCVQCPDYDICGSCESQSAHAMHYMLRVPGPRPREEVQSMLESLRRLLYQKEILIESNSCSHSNYFVDSVKLEVKEEQVDGDPLQIVTEQIDTSQLPVHSEPEDTNQIEEFQDSDEIDSITENIKRDSNLGPQKFTRRIRDKIDNVPKNITTKRSVSPQKIIKYFNLAKSPKTYQKNIIRQLPKTQIISKKSVRRINIDPKVVLSRINMDTAKQKKNPECTVYNLDISKVCDNSTTDDTEAPQLLELE